MNVSTIIDKINNFFQQMDSKATKVMQMPAIFLLCAAMSRQGLSVLKSLSNVCVLLEEAGIPTGSNPDGSPNLIVKASHAIIQEVYRALTEDAVVQGSIKPGEMMLLSQGANAGGPVVATGSNILPTHLWGTIE